MGTMAYVEVDLRDVDSDDLIAEIEDRSFTVTHDSELRNDMFVIRQAYLLETPDEFRKTIERMLSAAGMPV